MSDSGPQEHGGHLSAINTTLKHLDEKVTRLLVQQDASAAVQAVTSQKVAVLEAQASANEQTAARLEGEVRDQRNFSRWMMASILLAMGSGIGALVLVLIKG